MCPLLEIYPYASSPSLLVTSFPSFWPSNQTILHYAWISIDSNFWHPLLPDQVNISAHWEDIVLQRHLGVELWFCSCPSSGKVGVWLRIIYKPNAHFFFFRQLVIENSPCNNRCRFKREKAIWQGQDWLYNLWSPEQNENEGPLFKKF